MTLPDNTADVSSPHPTTAATLHARTTSWSMLGRVAWWVLLLPVALALFSVARLSGWPRRAGLAVAAILALFFGTGIFAEPAPEQPKITQFASAGQASEDAGVRRQAELDRAAATAAAKQAAEDRAAAEAAAAQAAADKAAAEKAAAQAAAARAAAEKDAATKAAAAKAAQEAAAQDAARQQSAQRQSFAAPAEESGGTDPRFGTCREAKANGYGPYREGRDPEYDWYRDADSDGVVCE